MLFKRLHINVPCTVLEAHGAYYGSQNLPTVVLFDALSGVAAAGKALTVMIATIQRILCFFSSLSFFSLRPWYLYKAFKKLVVSTSFYLFWIWSLFFLFSLFLLLFEVFFLFHPSLINFITFLYHIWYYIFFIAIVLSFALFFSYFFI